MVGSELAGYHVEALIGRGGMGAVYRAEELTLGRKVALKVIAPELAQDSRFRERFLRESRMAASLDHPHIVPIFQAGEEDGALFLAMRYVEGTDLGKLLAEGGALAPARAIALLEQVADGLDAAHEKGLVHRDVKPSNVLVSRAAGKEHAYLADFGLTKRTGSLSGLSVAGEVVGTIEYVAPEQITDDEVGPPADLYSLGCVLYECLTGQSPFPRATDVALLWAHVHEDALPPRSLRPELRPAIDGVLARALAKDPARRYSSADELVSAARSALGLVETAPARPTRRRLALAAAGVAVLVVAALLGFLLTRDSGGGLSGVSPNAVGVIDPKTNELVADVPVGFEPEAIAAGEGGVWVANTRDAAVSRLDPASRTRIATIPVGGYPSDIAAGNGSVWVAFGYGHNEVPLGVRRIDPVGNAAERPTIVGGQYPLTTHIDLGAGSVWHLTGYARIARFDPRTGEAAQIGVDEFLLVFQDGQSTKLSDVAFGIGSLWITNEAGNSVTEFDPRRDRVVSQVTVGGAPIAIAVRGRTLWVANFDDDTVSRIELPEPGVNQPRTVETFPVGDGPVDIAVDETGVWVANSLDRTVSRLDPESGDMVATIDIGNEPRRIAAGEGAVWVTVQAPGE